MIPMVAEEEALEREREREREKQEAESRLIKDETDEEITDSKNRVYEHFKQVSQIVSESCVPVVPRKSVKIPLSQMHGRKRKRDSNINRKPADGLKEKADAKLLTPIPSLEGRITQGVKKELDEEQVVRGSLSKSLGGVSNDETISTIR